MPAKSSHEVNSPTLSTAPPSALPILKCIESMMTEVLTVEEHLDSGAFTPEAWRTRKARKERVLSIFEPLRMLMKTPAGRLSGGERRMVSIGRGLMADAKLYLADEPSLGLAPKIGMAV